MMVLIQSPTEHFNEKLLVQLNCEEYESYPFKKLVCCLFLQQIKLARFYSSRVQSCTVTIKKRNERLLDFTKCLTLYHTYPLAISYGQSQTAYDELVES
jgi:hypothetical protein